MWRSATQNKQFRQIIVYFKYKMDYYDEVVEIKNKPKRISSQNSADQLPASNEVTSLDRRKPEPIFSTSNDDSERTTQKRPTSSLPRNTIQKIEHILSESESSDSDTDDNLKHSTEGFDYKQWEDLNVSSEIKEIFQYIPRYSAPKIDIVYTLQPFIPDFIPAVGDIDAFLKVVPPKPLSENSRVVEFIDRLGLEMLDEPCGEQSEPALLHMKLRSVSTNNPRTPGPPPAVSKSSKDIEKWIVEVQALHANQPYPMVIHSKPAPDIDSLMVEWPSKMEHILNTVGFPSVQLNCSMKYFIELMCGMFDIPLPPTNNQVDYLLALNTLFNLYLAIKNPVE